MPFPNPKEKMKKLSIKNDNVQIQKSEFVESVQKALKTPVTQLKYCYLSKPFFYPGSSVPRYSITLLFDKVNPAHKKFLESLEKLAKENGVETLGYIDNGLISIKFQGKESPRTFSIEKGQTTETEVSLEHDVPEGFEACVEFELNTYFNKSTSKKGFNFCPKKVTFYIEDDIQTGNEKNEADKSRGNRSRAKNNGVRDSKLRSGKERVLGDKLRHNPNARRPKGD